VQLKWVQHTKRADFSPINTSGITYSIDGDMIKPSHIRKITVRNETNCKICLMFNSGQYPDGPFQAVHGIQPWSAMADAKHKIFSMLFHNYTEPIVKPVRQRLASYVLFRKICECNRLP